MKQIWQAEDGSVFETEEECLNYESSLKATLYIEHSCYTGDLSITINVPAQYDCNKIPAIIKGIAETLKTFKIILFQIDDNGIYRPVVTGEQDAN